MPDQTVQVTYNPSATPAWSFSTDPVTLTASGKIILTRAPHSNWAFTGAAVSSGGSQFGTPNVNPAGTEITISDLCTLKGSWCYTVSVLPSGATESVTSPDPEIVNDPPTGDPAPPKPPE